ncbi:MAG: pyrroloquinoline quinone biosynthesis protein PqqB [Acidobacteria bacterium]|nr:MAG: pyrroloquinoline quinone biosynthesis protein PqqB [Acidobacteriota bacterium]
MLVKILGSAAGGGFPQWNCGCVNCHGVRDRSFKGSFRTQAQLAWSAAPSRWSLLNASPDLRVQIEATPDLWPPNGTRNSPIHDVILASAEVDQVLGLLLLREFHSFRAYATRSVRKILTEDNSLFGVLARFPGQVCWQDIPLDRPFCAGGARLEVLPLRGSFPGFVRAPRLAELNAADAVIGLLISPELGASSSGRTLAFLPGVSCIPDALLERLQSCDVLLFDGTFWSDDEPLQIPGVTRTARQMGHVPLSGPGGSLECFAALQRPRKIFIHINHTNPILDEESMEHRMVREAGWEVAGDGMEMTL